MDVDVSLNSPRIVAKYFGFSGLLCLLRRLAEAQKSDCTAARRETTILGESSGFNQQPGQTLDKRWKLWVFFLCFVDMFICSFLYFSFSFFNWEMKFPEPGFSCLHDIYFWWNLGWSSTRNEEPTERTFHFIRPPSPLPKVMKFNKCRGHSFGFRLFSDHPVTFRFSIVGKWWEETCEKEWENASTIQNYDHDTVQYTTTNYIMDYLYDQGKLGSNTSELRIFSTWWRVVCDGTIDCNKGWCDPLH